jgi:hypothetical protein
MVAAPQSSPTKQPHKRRTNSTHAPAAQAKEENNRPPEKDAERPPNDKPPPEVSPESKTLPEPPKPTENPNQKKPVKLPKILPTKPSHPKNTSPTPPVDARASRAEQFPSHTSPAKAHNNIGPPCPSGQPKKQNPHTTDTVHQKKPPPS